MMTSIPTIPLHCYITYPPPISIFINLFAGGSNLPSQKDALAHFAPGNVFIDARAGTADIPGDGTTKVTFTSAQDTARFVAESLDLEKWDEVSGIVGETTTFEEVVDIVDRVTGKKMVRTYVMQGGGERAEKLLENKYLEGVRCLFSHLISFALALSSCCLLRHF